MAAARPAPSRAAACPAARTICAASSGETRRRLSANMMPMKSAPASAAATASATRMQPQILMRVIGVRSPVVGRQSASTWAHDSPSPQRGDRRFAVAKGAGVRCSTYANASATRSSNRRVVSSVRRGSNVVAADPGWRSRASGSRGCDSWASRVANLRINSFRSGQTHSMRIGRTGVHRDLQPAALHRFPEHGVIQHERVPRRDERRACAKYTSYAPDAASRSGMPVRRSAALITSLSRTVAPRRAPIARATVLLPLPGSPCIWTTVWRLTSNL